MKRYIKGVITGILLGVAIASVPVVAGNIDVLFNTVRININGVDKVQWGEEMKLTDGSAMPTSILYNGTTYLPIRKISELSGENVYWNGDSNTISITEEAYEPTVITEKPDSCGNTWRYYTFKTKSTKKYVGEHQYYLGVRDETRGFERVYRILGRAVTVTDDAVYFVKVENEDGYYKDYEYYVLTKLLFSNEANSQDGEVLCSLGGNDFIRDAVFDGDYLFLAGRGPGTHPHAVIKAYNFISGGREKTYVGVNGKSVAAYDLRVQNDGSSAILKFKGQTTGPVLECELIFDKTTNVFGEMSETYTEENMKKYMQSMQGSNY